MEPPIEDPHTCYEYFRWVRHERWPEAEKTMLSHSRVAAYYIYRVSDCYKNTKLREKLEAKAKELGTCISTGIIEFLEKLDPKIGFHEQS